MKSFVINLYKESDGRWFFDDATKNIKHEEFVAGVPEIIEYYLGEDAEVAQIEFTGDTPNLKTAGFPWYTLTYLCEKDGGVVYKDSDDVAEYGTGWFCPTFWEYFNDKNIPATLSFRVVPN